MKGTARLLVVGVVSSVVAVADAQVLPPIEAVQVSFAGGALDTFKVAGTGVTGGGVRFMSTATPTSKGAQILSVTGSEYLPLTIRSTIPDAAANLFDTDLAPNVKSIAMEPIVIDTPKTSGGYISGRPTFGTVTFTFASASTAAQEWARVAPTSQGRRTVTVNLRTGGAARVEARRGVLRTYVLRDCVVVSYATTGLPVLVVQPSRVEISSPLGDHPGWLAWYADALNQGAARDVTVIGIGRPSGATAPVGERFRYTTRRSLITQMILPQLDVESQNLVTEGFTFQPNQIEKFP